MAYLDFLSSVHKKTTRDYVSRVVDPEFPKAKAAQMALAWAEDYWDKDRRTGYGGYRYDGRWRTVAAAMAKHYNLKAGDKVLDVGCGKGFLLYDLTLEVPGLEVTGIDISQYALQHAVEDIRPNLQVASADSLPFETANFDYVFSINTLHNLPNYQLDRALREMQRVSRQHRYLCVESFRNEEEKVNLLYWQLTCRAFCSPEEWEWWFKVTGYQGDHSFIYFE